MNKQRLFLGAVIMICAAILLGCAAEPKLTYTPRPTEGYVGKGFPFVVPRTVVRVVPTIGKDNKVESLVFTPVPVATSADGASQLPTFVATDSSSGWSFTPTTVTSVVYADDLIVSAIGTQVADNRKEVIDVIVSVAGLAGAFAGGGCKEPRTPLKPFVIASVDGGGSIEGSDCWAYSIARQKFQLVGRKAYPVGELSEQAGKVAWFPIPACQEYRLRVFQCGDKTCTSELGGSMGYETVLSLSDGQQYQRIPLSSKGKISLRPDFCGADVTNESVATSNYGLLKQVITDVKAEKKK